MDRIELIDKRKPREKHFLQKDGTIRAEIYNDDIHYLKNGKYEEIDNTLVNENTSLVNKSNDYRVEFKNDFKESLMKISKEKNYIDFKIRNTENMKLQTNRRNVSNQMKNVVYNDINDDISFEYQTLSNKVKETIVLQNANYYKLSFELDTNLDLRLNEKSGDIVACDNNNIIFKIEKPFMIDSNGIRNNNVHYSIENYADAYILNLVLDDEWLSSTERKFPVYVDPTITNGTYSLNVYDTYIFPGDTNVDRNSESIMKAGVEINNNTLKPNRALIKFELPEIGTGSEILNAELVLTPYSSDTYEPEEKLAEVHRITSDWLETTANWDNMHDQYEDRVESLLIGSRRGTNTEYNAFKFYYADITHLVKNWYKDTANYGLMIKAIDESVYDDDDFPIFYSKNNLIYYSDPRPYIIIEYRNQNGLENYMYYTEQNLFNSNFYVNDYNGNLVGIINLIKTVNKNMPINLKLIYNTNDVILNNDVGLGKGYKFNYNQKITERTIDNENYLEFIDEDGTIHYFSKYNENDEYYYDEDGLNFKIKKENSKCTLIDKYNNKSTFINDNNIYYLKEIENSEGDKITLTLDNNHKITSATDGNIVLTISYQQNYILISDSNLTSKINYQNNKISAIETNDGTMYITYSNDLLASVVDITGLKYVYQYYNNSPYKVKKVMEYGLNDTLGRTNTFNYGDNSTTITDNENRNETLIFNSYGNVLSRNMLDENEDLKNAYSLTSEYNKYLAKNKMTSSSVPVKYIKNYLSNISFEENDNYFTSETGISSVISTDFANSGSKSLKVTSTDLNKSISQVVQVEKGNDYTFSGYFKNNNKIKISLGYTNQENVYVEEEEIIEASDSFSKEDVTINYPTTALSDLIIKICHVTTGISYIDDIQLEVGKVANAPNLIDNSDFSKGYLDWDPVVYDMNSQTELNDITPFFNIVNVNNTNRALKIRMKPNHSSRIRKTFPISGRQGDVYTVSFWYKNEGIPPCRQHADNCVMINFHPTDGSAEYCAVTSTNFETNYSKWQYYSYRDVAIEDYDSVSLIFMQNTQANDMYITDISFSKNITSGDYSYDSKGNLISVKRNDNSESQFSYDINDNLVNIQTPVNETYKYEHDNENKGRLLSSLSSEGIMNKYEYDSNGNMVLFKVTSNYKESISNGNYRIRCKGTKLYFKAEMNSLILEESNCSNTIWNITKNNDIYNFKYAALSNFHITYDNDATIYISNDSNIKNYYIEQNENGSFYIYTYDLSNNQKYLRRNQNQIVLDDLILGDNTFEFYFESDKKLFIENNATYSNDGRFLESVTDSNLKTTSFTTNPTTGLQQSTTNANGIVTYYSYNQKQQHISSTCENQSVEYSYNNGHLSQISYGTTDYDYEYDDFYNTKSIKINDTIQLMENEFEPNNGSLTSITYGNDDEINYSYDELGRLSTIDRMDNTFNLYYDNNGNIAKIISNDNIIREKYDIADRLLKYDMGDYKVKYEYDENNNIVKRSYKVNNNSNAVLNEFDNDILIKQTLDNDEINYSYDELQRLVQQTLGNGHVINYSYITNGNRTTELIDTIKHQGIPYRYVYDNLDNISEIYYNGNLVERYNYDNHNQLISEEDIINNTKKEYTYDNEGNMITEVIKQILSGQTISTNNYSYENNNWKHQLTKYNSTSIQYDEIGNVTNIGNTVSLNWTNGSVLEEYVDTAQNLDILYKYNVNGNRTYKRVGNEIRNYYLENNDIIYETGNNGVIYYLYDLTGVIGLEYNGNKYYYIKNLQNDVIGILNSQNNQIVSYTYDAWGNIISIKDGNNNDIQDPSNIGMINPFRYRSYYYDSETDLYYVNNRYYSPKLHRFISIDSAIQTQNNFTGYNLYTYCYNNPISYVDDTGNFGTFLLGLTAGEVAVYSVLLLTAAYIAAKSLTTVLPAIYSNVKSTIDSITKPKTKTKTNTSKKNNKDNDNKNHNVYVLKDTEASPQVIEYVGRTVDLQRTEYRHSQNAARSHLKLQVVARNVDRNTARGLEQMYIIRCKTLKKGFPTNNQINGVSEKNLIKHPEFWNAATEWVDENNHLSPC